MRLSSDLINSKLLFGMLDLDTVFVSLALYSTEITESGCFRYRKCKQLDLHRQT